MKNYLPAEEITLVHSGRNYFEALETIIDQSQKTLHIQTYIFLADETGLRVIAALQKAVERGVIVCVLADAFGCYPSGKLITAMHEAGVHFRLFARFFSSESIYFARRLHHKTVVADRKIALTGGINIADKYNDIPGEAPWLDYAVLARGEACQYLHLLCEKFYYKKGSRAIKAWERSYGAVKPGQPRLLRYGCNDWLKRKDEIHHSYVHALVHAKRSVTIVASYFLPGYLFRKLLKDATQRGITVRIILAGKSDSTSVRLAESYLYEFYIRNNILVYEWKNSVMHGKAMVIDDAWASIGSYNINYLSRYLSIELNADVKDETFAKQFLAHLEDICTNDCNFMNAGRSMEERTAAGRLGIWIAYHFHRLLQNIVMLGRKHRTNS